MSSDCLKPDILQTADTIHNHSVALGVGNWGKRLGRQCKVPGATPTPVEAGTCLGISLAPEPGRSAHRYSVLCGSATLTGNCQ